MIQRYLVLIFAAAILFGTSQAAHANLLAEESFVGYDADFLNGQQTSSTTGFAGTETWDRNTSENAVRDFDADPGNGLSYSTLEVDGGSAELYRTSSFNDDGSTQNRATLVPSSTITSISSTTLYFSAILNADGYTAKSDDASVTGAEVVFLHEDNDRRLGFGFGGESGGDEDAAKTLFVRGEVGEDSARIQSTLVLDEGDNLVVLSIERLDGGTGDNIYSLWLNPDLDSPGAAPWTSTQDFGIVPNNGSFGFFGFELGHQFNGPQSVFADELRLGTTFESVTPTDFVIPEPATAGLLALGALGLLARRRRQS